MCKKRNLIVLASLLVLLTIAGSVFDLEIAKTAYIGQYFKENPFGIIFSFIGVIPTFVGWSFLGASILYLVRQKEEGKKRKWLTALSILLFVLAFFYFCNSLMLANASAFSVHWAIAYPIGLLTLVGAAYLGYRLCKNSDNPDLLKNLLFLACVSLVTMVVIMLTKEIMGRPRYRLVLAMGNEEFYKNWWESGKQIEQALGISVSSDQFASFPSGHSAYSMFAIFIFPAFTLFRSKWEKYRGLLFVCGIVWWALTAFSRMTVAAHYLTDVSIAGLVTIGAYALVLFGKKALDKKKERETSVKLENE